jgi:DNA-binding MarR family transcriptional regulator
MWINFHPNRTKSLIRFNHLRRMIRFSAIQRRERLVMKFMPVEASEAAGTADQCKRQAHDLRRSIDELCHSLERVKPQPIAANCFVDAPTAVEVRKVISARRARERLFAPGLFADPAWDILLELFATSLANQRIAVSTLCARAAVPVTTALRWIHNLEEAGLVTRQEDPLDRRRVFVALSVEASLTMASLFKSIAPAAVI